MRVLLASPDREARDRARATLRGSSSVRELVEVEDAASARAALADSPFDLVVASEGLPIDHPGVQVVRTGDDVAAALAYVRPSDDTSSERVLAETIQRIGESLAAEHDLDTMVQEVVAHARTELRAHCALLYGEFTWRDRTERISAAAGSGELSPEDIATLVRSSLIPPAAFTEPVLQRSDPDATPAETAAITGPVGCLTAAPVTAPDGTIRGTLVLTHPSPRAFDDHDLQRARAIANLAAVAIVNAGARRELDRAVQVREQILAVASHDLRNPLSVFNMALDLLADSDSAEQRRDVVGRARRSVERMRRLISDILDYAAIDAGTLRVERAPVDPSRIIDDALEAVAGEAEKKSIDLKLVLDESLPRLDADRGRLVQALTNLLTNAIKFTPRSGVVTVRGSSSEGNAVFSVTDTGPGIPEEEQTRLFDRYYSSGSKQQKSVGLGLAIALGIAEAHDGMLLVESTLGEGSTFLLSVPAKAG